MEGLLQLRDAQLDVEKTVFVEEMVYTVRLQDICAWSRIRVSE